MRRERDEFPGVVILVKAFLGIPAQQAPKITRLLMSSAAPAVLLHSQNLAGKLPMRNVFPPQMSIGQIDIADIQIDVSSRDDIPVILLGLQQIYTTPPLRDAVFKILEEVKPFPMPKKSFSCFNRIPYGLVKARPVSLLNWACGSAS